MTHILHQLRARSRAISRSLLLVLLATWVSMVCPPCVTQAEAAPVQAPAMHCHEQEAPLSDQQSGILAGCQSDHSGPCADGNCNSLSAITVSEPAAALIASSEPPLVFLPTVVTTYLDDRPLQHRPEPLRMSAADDGPLYLRHCCFLN